MVAQGSTGASEELSASLQCQSGQLVKLIGIGFAEVDESQPVCNNVRPAVLNSDGTYKVIGEGELTSKGQGHAVVEHYAQFREDCSSYQSHAFRTSEFVDSIVS